MKRKKDQDELRELVEKCGAEYLVNDTITLNTEALSGIEQSRLYELKIKIEKQSSAHDFFDRVIKINELTAKASLSFKLLMSYAKTAKEIFPELHKVEEVIRFGSRACLDRVEKIEEESLDGKIKEREFSYHYENSEEREDVALSMKDNISIELAKVLGDEAEKNNRFDKTTKRTHFFIVMIICFVLGYDIAFSNFNNSFVFLPLDGGEMVNESNESAGA